MSTVTYAKRSSMGNLLITLKQIIQIRKKLRRFKTGFTNKLLNVVLILAISPVLKTLIRITEAATKRD